MPVPTSISDLSTTASSNPPAGTETPQEGDNHLRAAYSFIRQTSDRVDALEVDIPDASTNLFIDTLQVANIADSDPDRLDFYQERDYTPIASGNVSTGVGTYSVQDGKYQRIGNWTRGTIHLTWSAHTGSGNIYVSLPIACVGIAGAIVGHGRYGHPSLGTRYFNLLFSSGTTAQVGYDVAGTSNWPTLSSPGAIQCFFDYRV